MKALAIKRMLSYEPVIHPKTPMTRMTIFLQTIHGVTSDTLQLQTSSKIGGNNKAMVVLLKAPTNVMNRFKKGIISARTTTKLTSISSTNRFVQALTCYQNEKRSKGELRKHGMFERTKTI